MQLQIPVPRTPEGRVYRYSPNENAHPRHFVLGDTVAGFVTRDDLRSRMKQPPHSPETVCPYSGIIAPDADFIHPDDIEAAKEIVKHAAIEDVHEQVSKILGDVARSTHSNKFVRIEHKSNHQPRPKPRFGRRDLMRLLVCDHCGRDYGVFAIGLFCPDCGAPNLRLHFEREVELVRQQVDLAQAQTAQDEELAYRLLGNAHEDVLTAFEATMKAVYAYHVTYRAEPDRERKPVQNDFQNIDRGRRRFAAFDFDPFASLSAAELEVLALNIQKRHVVGHNLGVVDDKFALVTSEARLGETVPLVSTDVRAFAAVAQKVVDILDGWIASGEAVVLPERPVTPELSQAIESLLSGELPLTERAAHWLCAQSEAGMPRWADGQTILDGLGGPEAKDLELALAELEADGLIETRNLRGSGALPMVRQRLDLFVTYDQASIGSDPTADAATLAQQVLDGPDSVNVENLHRESGWSALRFNPAVALVIDQVDERRVSQEITDDYPTRHFGLTAQDRVALKRFVQRLRG